MSRKYDYRSHGYRLTKDKFLNDREFEKLTAYLGSASKRPRDILLINLALHTGARAQELLNIRPKDLDSDQHTVFIKGLKDSNDREIPLPLWLFRQLKAHADQTTGQTVFDITYPRLDQIWKSHRTCKKKFHALRHTFAIRLYQKTKDIKLVQMALGHRNLRNTLIYLDFTYGMDQMRRLLVG